jgi:hypothetical protein
MYGICLVWSGLVWSGPSACLVQNKRGCSMYACMYGVIRSGQVRKGRAGQGKARQGKAKVGEQKSVCMCGVCVCVNRGRAQMWTRLYQDRTGV